ncbi:ADP-ribosylation factor-like protein 15 isoform X2 [Cyprinus carpio]|uniref:ADP-ribosylation factor-like protein 15 n=1 Tax=Cyprinus carpio TaxID=7962 RepID=A0A9Q9WBP2_CYPCA|nr:ADP-ribosylation factor-like protein 15 isoform X2 [Cyprinus carpio]
MTVAILQEGYVVCLQKLCCKAPPPPRPEYDVVCIGLSGAGKTSLLSRLCNEISDGTVPTTGFSIKAVPFENAILNVKELGGAETIKKYWSRYYQGSQGVVFVLNSAASDEEMEASRSELLLAMQHPQLCTLPFLILANHQDSPAARSVSEAYCVSCHSEGSSPTRRSALNSDMLANRIDGIWPDFIFICPRIELTPIFCLTAFLKIKKTKNQKTINK